MISFVIDNLSPDTVLAANEQSVALAMGVNAVLYSEAEGGGFDLFVAAGTNRNISGVEDCATIVLMGTDKRENRLDASAMGKFKSRGYKIVYKDNITVMTTNADLVLALEDYGKGNKVTIQPAVPFVGTTVPPEYKKVMVPRPPVKKRKGKKDEG
jgi:hypothetical protein